MGKFDFCGVPGMRSEVEPDEKHLMEDNKSILVDVSSSPLVIELLINRYGMSTNTDPHIIRAIEQEIIYEGLRLQKK